MIKVIGKENCSNCAGLKTFLEGEGIEFTYTKIESLPKEEQIAVKKRARISRVMSFPLVIKNDVMMTDKAFRDSLVLTIIKRSGKEVLFDKDRIASAINNAMFELGDVDNDLSIKIATEIGDEVESQVSVEDIQDIIVAKLNENKREDVAIRYSDYREIKNKERERKSLSSIDMDNLLLTDTFISKYKHIPAPMTPLGSFVYYRTYSRWLPELERREFWYETVRRAVEYNASLANTSKDEAETLFDNIFNLRQFLSGRTLFTGGTKVSRNYALSNFNCALRSIDNLEAFGEVFYVLMLGTGAGVRVIKEDVDKILPVRKDIEIIHKKYKGINKKKRQENTSLISKNNTVKIVVGDSKEGWKESLDMYFKVLSSHTFNNVNSIIFDYDNVRPKGERLKTFGGRASGHESVKAMFTKVHEIITKIEGTRYVRLRPIDALDICNIVGENVVSGGVRRTSEVGVFDKNDTDILNAKTNLYKKVDGEFIEDTSISFRKMSNNSIFYKEKPTREELHKHLETLKTNGEPGFINEEAGLKRRSDFKGLNPCCEILLDNEQTCNLTTINVMAFVKDNKLDIEGLLNAQRLSTRAGYRMTCTDLELPRWNVKQKKDRLLGLSLTGWQDMVNDVSLTIEGQIDTLTKLRETAHASAEEIAKETGGNVPILSTTVKPEGTLSLLPTVSSGIHYSHSPFFIRRVRITSTDPLLKVCEELGYPIHPEVGEDEETCNTKVVEFPVKAPTGRTKNDVSAVEQLENYKMFMKYYVDHNVSITVTVREHEWTLVEDWLWENWDGVVAVSFLPLFDSVYPLLPFEACTEEEYNTRMADMNPFNPNLIQKYEKEQTEEEEAVEDSECATGVCGVH